MSRTPYNGPKKGSLRQRNRTRLMTKARRARHEAGVRRLNELLSAG